MALNLAYFIGGPLDQFFIDHTTGLPLSDGVLKFWRDSARNVPKPVYELTGTPPNYNYSMLGVEVDLSGVGTIQDNTDVPCVIYYYPYDVEGNLDLYFIECFDSLGNLQWTREAWPNIGASGEGENPFEYNNQISNPQFVNTFLNLNQSMTFTVSAATLQVFAFGPDWEFVISGTGTVVVQQIPIAGDQNIITNPPYVIDVNVSSGITSCYLRQRFNYNSGLWASSANESIFLSAFIIAENQVSGTAGIEILYQPGGGASPTLILSGSFDNATYYALTGVTENEIPFSTDTNSGSLGYVDILVSFTPSSHVRISSVQVIPTISPVSTDILEYDASSSNRNQALLGDYYLPELQQRTDKNILVGWDFPVNPSQFSTAGTLVASTPQYVWDQTIAGCGASGTVAWARNSVSGGLQFTTGGTNDYLFIQQYLSGLEVKKLLGTPLALNFSGFQTNVGIGVSVKAYLCRAPSTSSIPILPTVLGTFGTDGTFTLTASGWTLIPRNGLTTAEGVLNVYATGADLNDPLNDIGWSQWQITDATQLEDTEFFAIVLTFSYTLVNTVVTINSVSLLPGNLPSRPAYQNFSETLLDCSHYYQKSFENSTMPAQAVGINTGESIFMQVVGGSTGSLSAQVRFAVKMRITPSITIYNPYASNAQIVDETTTLSWNNSRTNSISSKEFTVQGGTPAGSSANHAGGFHWTADSRLGLF